MKWVTAVTAPDEITAEMWRDLLSQEGIPAMIRPSDAVSFMGTSFLPCRLLVPEDLKEEALTILERYVGHEL